MNFEVAYNTDILRLFLICKDANEIFLLLDDYDENKNYNSDKADMILNVIYNALNFAITMLIQRGGINQIR